MNVVAMARHGPILKDNEATGSGKVFKYLRGLGDAIKKSKIAVKVQTCNNAVFYRIFYIWGPIKHLALCTGGGYKSVRDV